jgi:glycosyltransferase involved in cell wall biosynthesis
VSEKDPPTVSVVLTTFRRAHVLADTVHAILAQTFGDFELIIADDCSPDMTEQVARELAAEDPRIRYLRQPVNTGMPGNLNSGINLAHGGYVANLHDGDAYSPMLLRSWVDAMNRCPRAAFVFNAYQQSDERGDVIRTYQEELPPCFPGSWLIERLFFARWHFDSPVWGTVMARREAYVEAGLFDPRFGFVSDVDMWLRLSERYWAAYVADPLITLANRNTLPRDWSASRRYEKRLVRRMFWEARTRHYRGQPARAMAEAMKHGGFTIADSAYEAALATRHQLKLAGLNRGR